MNTKTKNQMLGVILLDCLTQLNAKGLDRTEYQAQLDAMLMERTGQTIDLADIERLIKD